MPSIARDELDVRLADFDELMLARDAICPTGRGRPSQRQGAAILRSSVVVLSAVFEAYVERVYDEAVDILLATSAESDRESLKNKTSRRLHNANSIKVNRLFDNIGIARIMESDRVRWQKFSNTNVRAELDRIVMARNGIAHGESRAIQKRTATRWRGVIGRLADRLDGVVADHVEQQTGCRPW